MKTVTLTELRRNIFQIADEALATGEPVVIKRNGRRLELRAEPDPEAEARRERWRRFWETPNPFPDQPPLTLEDFEGLAEWDEEPELDR